MTATDVDLSAFEAASRRLRKVRCPVALTLMQLEDDERGAQLRAALASDRFEHVAIEDVCRDAWNIPLNRRQIENHRNGKCACGH